MASDITDLLARSKKLRLCASDATDPVVRRLLLSLADELEEEALQGQPISARSEELVLSETGANP